MKKERNMLKLILERNKQLIIGLIIGIIFSSTIVYGAEIILDAKEIKYDDTKVAETLGETDVEGALKKLYEKADKCNSVTVLYNDGTFIINELPSQRNKNIVKHGNVVKTYESFSTSNPYIFRSIEDRPWNSDKDSITSVEVGTVIKPTDIRMWFQDLSNLSKADLSNIDTSNVTEMSHLFERAGSNVSSFEVTGISEWDTSKVYSMHGMFNGSGKNARTWSIGDLSNWDTTSVIYMAYMFENIKASQMESIGSLDVYAPSIEELFYDTSGVKATINIYSNPVEGWPGYSYAFKYAATASGSKITVNYSRKTTNINNIIATKSSNSNVVKGVQLD